jgi:hypothetical protein
LWIVAFSAAGGGTSPARGLVLRQNETVLTGA